MSGEQQSPKSEQDLTERQRYWLAHLRAAERLGGEPLKTYAKRLGLSAHSMYEAKRRLRACGVIAAAGQRKTTTLRFSRVAVERSEAQPRPTLRVRLANGAVLEWSMAPQGDVLRELIGLVS